MPASPSGRTRSVSPSTHASGRAAAASRAARDLFVPPRTSAIVARVSDRGEPPPADDRLELLERPPGAVDQAPDVVDLLAVRDDPEVEVVAVAHDRDVQADAVHHDRHREVRLELRAREVERVARAGDVGDD